MSLPTGSDVHVDVPLTNISLAYMQSEENFISTKVFPFIPTAKQSNKYYIYDRADFNRDQAAVRGPGISGHIRQGGCAATLDYASPN